MTNPVPEGTIILIIIPGVNSNAVDDSFTASWSNQPSLMFILHLALNLLGIKWKEKNYLSWKQSYK